MGQIDPISLDRSYEMKAYFAEVFDHLVCCFDKSPAEARQLVGTFFSVDVDPMERAFLMQTSPETVAKDLARTSR